MYCVHYTKSMPPALFPVTVASACGRSIGTPSVSVGPAVSDC